MGADRSEQHGGVAQQHVHPGAGEDAEQRMMPAPLQPHRDQNGDEGGPGAHGGRILSDEADQRMDEQQRQDGGRQEVSQGADEAVAAGAEIGRASCRERV